MEGDASFSQSYLGEVAELARAIPAPDLDAMADGIAAVRAGGGRLFLLGVGGGAGHASHAACDFRKLCGLESYAPTDNVSELTARVNDEGWDSSLVGWLDVSRLGSADGLLVFSVGGGSREHGVSMNLVNALERAHEAGAAIFGIVGKADGETARLADVCIVVDAPPQRRTPHVEGFQAVLWHLLVTHPALATAPGKWESIERQHAFGA